MLDEVRAIAALLKEQPRRQVVIKGHTDSIGTINYNVDLSLRRAESVKQALVDHDISIDRFVVKGMGEDVQILCMASVKRCIINIDPPTLPNAILRRAKPLPRREPWTRLERKY